MNHTFVRSLTDATKCRQCKRPEIEHTDNATCESCGKENVKCEIIDGDILACEFCQERDKEIEAEIAQLGNTREERVANVKAMMEKNRQIDTSIKVVSDIFNAKTIAIVKLKETIDADSTIENKQFRLAQVLDERYHHLREILLPDLRKQVAESENEQRAIQQYYNELAKKLRADEREQIRLKDVNYQPVETKPKKQRAPTVKSVNKEQLKEFTVKLENEFGGKLPKMKGAFPVLLQTTSVSKSVDIPAAYEIVKGMLSSLPANQ